MNDPKPQAKQSSTEDVADQNVGRLLCTAYRPQAPTADFVQRANRAMAAEANRRSGSQPAGRGSAIRRVTVLAVAASLLIALGALLGGLWTGAFHDGPVPEESLAEREPSGGTGLERIADQLRRGIRHWPVADALTARPRSVQPDVQKLAVGESLQTGSGERRRVGLPDGSIVYLNRDTAITLQSARRIALDRGEIFVEVAPRYDVPRTEEAETEEANRFVVFTPDRELTALGTKFNVRTEGQKTSVAVVQGRVQVSGVAEPLSAGQELAATDGDALTEAVTAIDQTTHVIDWTRDLIVAAESPLVPASDYAGGALVAKGPDGQETSLSMRRYHVDVHIEDGFARTTIDQTYFNHETSRMEGTFYFPLPPDASLSRLAMYVGGQLMEGGMAEREHAREVFETIVRRQKDPALLEWIDGSTFKMRVFPLEGRQEKRIVLSYTQRLSQLGDRAQYRFPGGHNMPRVDRWSCHVHARGSAGCRWEADAYDFKASKKGGDLVLDAAAEGIKPDRNIVIHLHDPESEKRERRELGSPSETHTRFVTADHEQHRYLALRYPFRPTLKSRPRRRDWVFLFEASADRDPVLARVQVDVIKTLLENAEREDTFTILAASSRIRRLAEQPLQATAKNVKKAVRFLESTQLVGALDLAGALQAASADLDSAENPCLVHVGSGFPKLGEKDHDALLQLIPPETCYSGVGVGNRWNQAFMKQATGATGGYFTQINPDESVQWRTIELLSRLNAPRLVDIHVVDDRERLQFLTPTEVVCQGEELFAVARLDAGKPLPDFVEVTGRLGNDTFVRRLPVSETSSDADYLPRTWAKLEVDRMVAEDALGHRDEIVSLSMAMYVMSPFTSLLVLENEQMYKEFNVDRGRKDHWALYPCPEKIDVVHEPLAGPPDPPKPQVAEAEEPEEQKPSVAEVLQTILVRRRGARGSGDSAVSVWHLVQPRYVWDANQHGYWYFAPTNWDRYESFSQGLGPWGISGSVPLGWRQVDLDFGRGVPMLSKVPYVSRLFGNAGVGRQTQSLMAMVTPRIIIQEEEELFMGSYFTLDGLELLDNGRARGVRYDVNGNGEADFDSLISLITQTVTPETWTEVGGSGSIRPYPSNLSLMVSSDYLNFTGAGLDIEQRLSTKVYPVSDLVLPITSLSFTADGRSLMGGMGGMGGPMVGMGDSTVRLWNGGQLWGPDSGLQFGGWDVDNDGDGGFLDMGWRTPHSVNGALTYPNPRVWADLTSRRRRYASIDLSHFGGTEGAVVDALNRSTSTDFEKATLSEAVAFLKELHDIQIDFDESAMSAAGIALDAPVTLRVQDISLRSALQLILQPLELTFVVRDGRIRVVPISRLHSMDAEIHDLLAFAPGLHTTRADIQFVLEAEAEVSDKPAAGKVDKRAAALIDRAQSTGWSSVTISGPSDAKTRFTFDGHGRCRIETQTSLGLKEQILCDGEWVWHQYPELGVGARRPNSRFHRAGFLRSIPWLVAPVEDLAYGADIRYVDASTVAIVLHGPKEEASGDADERESPELRLLFADDGRLAERQIVLTPSNKTILRVAYGSDGTVQYLGRDSEVLYEQKFSVETCAQPELRPEESLVIVPMPWRSRKHVLATGDMKDDGTFKGWSDEDALAILAADTATGNASLRSTIGWRFLNRGDQRLGLYTLLLAAGVDWNSADDADSDPELDVRRLFNPLEENPESPLAQYIAAVQRIQAADEPQQIGALGGSRTGFLQQLAAMRDLSLAWQQAKPGDAGQKQRDRLERQSVRFLQRSRCTPFGTNLLSAVWRYGGEESLVRVLDETEGALRDQSPTAFAVHFLHAQMVARSGDKGRGLELFESLVVAMQEVGFYSLVDEDIKKAFYGDQQKEAWRDLIEGIAEQAVQQASSPSVLAIARRLHRLGEPEAAERIFASVTAAGGTEKRVSRTLAGVDYLWSTDQRTRAAAMLQPLLDDDRLSETPELWKLASVMAEQRGLPARSAEYLDQALDLQYAQLPDEVDLKALRCDFGALLQRYREAADSVADAGLVERQRLVGRVVRAADRWRALDPETGDVCRLAADPLAQLGAVDLAWDYITSPLAGQEEATIAWKERGRQYHLQGRYELAQRSYRMAFEAEPTDAEALWQQAQTLIESGRRDQARPVLKRLTNGEWDPKYDAIRQQAQRASGQN